MPRQSQSHGRSCRGAEAHRNHSVDARPLKQISKEPLWPWPVSCQANRCPLSANSTASSTRPRGVLSTETSAAKLFNHALTERCHRCLLGEGTSVDLRLAHMRTCLGLDGLRSHREAVLFNVDHGRQPQRRRSFLRHASTERNPARGAERARRDRGCIARSAIQPRSWFVGWHHARSSSSSWSAAETTRLQTCVSLKRRATDQ